MKPTIKLSKEAEEAVKNQIKAEELRIERAQIFVAINMLYAQKILTLTESMRCTKRLQELYYQQRKKLL